MKKKLTIVFMGDSCIDAGRDRARPTESFGNGYVAMVTAMLRQRLPRIDFTFVKSISEIFSIFFRQDKDRLGNGDRRGGTIRSHSLSQPRETAFSMFFTTHL